MKPGRGAKVPGRAQEGGEVQEAEARPLGYGGVRSSKGERRGVKQGGREQRAEHFG